MAVPLLGDDEGDGQEGLAAHLERRALRREGELVHAADVHVQNLERVEKEGVKKAVGAKERMIVMMLIAVEGNGIYLRES